MWDRGNIPKNMLLRQILSIPALQLPAHVINYSIKSNGIYTVMALYFWNVAEFVGNKNHGKLDENTGKTQKHEQFISNVKKINSNQQKQKQRSKFSKR